MTQEYDPYRFVVSDYDFRCRGCNRALCRLRLIGEGSFVSIPCPVCNTLNVLEAAAVPDAYRKPNLNGKTPREA